LKENKDKQNIVVLLFLIAAISLLAKSAQIQIMDSSFADKARKATLEKEDQYPTRGLIYDRNEKLIVVNESLFDMKATFNRVDPLMDTSFFCTLLDITNKEYNEYLNKDWKDHRYHKSIPFTFLSKIEPKIYSRYQEHQHEFPGFSLVKRNIRDYPVKSSAHVVGYLGEVNENDIEIKPESYGLGDYIGKSGVELVYEDVLKGEKGVKYLIKDNLGREVSAFEEGRLDSVALAGKDVHLSLDLDLQMFGEELMQGKRGSIVAIEPSTGEILTMISAPEYDPNVFQLKKGRGEKYHQLAKDTINKPFLDRSVNAKYPPGSIFKPILSLIALQEKATYQSRTIFCDGYYQYRGFRYGCHAHPVPYNMPIAIEHSCNSYFFQVVRDLIETEGFSKPHIGLNLMRDHLKDFGLGEILGIDTKNEKKGFIPGPEYYDNLYKEEISGWKSTYIMSIGIGQGELELTTVQMANLAAIIANRGEFYIPHIVKKIENDNISDKYLVKRKVRIDQKHFAPVIYGMEKAVNTGTAQQAKIKGVRVAGKTGTSQNPHGKDHSVFFAFAPKDNPKIAIAVYVENAGFGGAIAAPIAGLMMEKYLKGEVPEYKNAQVEYLKNKILIEKPVL